MRWINMTEKEMLKAWANEEYTPELENQYLPMPDSKRESYWQECDGGRDILKFDFNTVPELLEQLKDAMPEKTYEDILLPLAVAAFSERKTLNESKLRQGDKQEKNSNGNNDAFEIPEFVYVF